MRRMMARVGVFSLAMLIGLSVWTGCGPAGQDDGEVVGAISFDVTAPAGAPVVWAVLFGGDARRSVMLDVDLGTGRATGSVMGLPSGAWQVLVLSEPDPDADVWSGHLVVEVMLTGGGSEEVAGTLEPVIGRYFELSFNPSGPVFAGSGELNPFAVPRVREAMNRLFDRQAIAALVLADVSVAYTGVFPALTASVPTSAEYRDMTAFFEGVERAYAEDAVLAAEVIAEEMLDLGAVRVDGIWHYDGEPVTVILVIRTEDSRVEVGDYVANQLEDVGFVTDRQYVSAAEATPLWLQGDPAEGLFHIYTGAWITTRGGRHTQSAFQFFFTPDGLDAPLWQAYTPSVKFYDVASRLAEEDYADEAERRALLQEAVALSLEDSVRVFLVEAVWRATFLD